MLGRNLLLVILMVSLIGCSPSPRFFPSTPPSSPAAPTRTPLPTSPPPPTPTMTPSPALLERAASLGLGPQISTRLATQSTTGADERLIAALEAGELFPIDGLLFESLTGYAAPHGAPPEVVLYVLPDPHAGRGRTAAWQDPATGEVVETATGYHLNLRQAPGMGIVAGAQGQQFYVYGFAWYPRWERILPEPLIALLEDFYAAGVEHVRGGMPQYQEVADPEYYGGELGRLAWDDELPEAMLAWGDAFPAAPFLGLPDAGTIDISDQRFYDALEKGLIEIDQASLERYLASDYPANSIFRRSQTRRTVTSKLLGPFQHPERFSALQKLLILGALEDGRGPLQIIIDLDLHSGIIVPDSGRKVMYIAASEVDLMFGYDGMVYAKLPHAMAHLLEFRDHPFLAEGCLRGKRYVVETFKYLIEYMWWVQQYPGNAPYWHWEPIGSGLALARLLSGYYPDFGCRWWLHANRTDQPSAGSPWLPPGG